jgi:Fe-S cluster biogenesis protein NfuA
MALALEEAITSALDRDVKPYLQAHGGDVVLEKVQDGNVQVRFVAACAACQARPVTFAATVRRRLMLIPGVKQVTCDSVELSPAKCDAISALFAD